jgi:hypothetical protein
MHFQVGNERQISSMDFHTEPRVTVFYGMSSPPAGANGSFVKPGEIGTRILSKFPARSPKGFSQDRVQAKAGDAKGFLFKTPDWRIRLAWRKEGRRACWHRAGLQQRIEQAEI